MPENENVEIMENVEVQDTIGNRNGAIALLCGIVMGAAGSFLVRKAKQGIDMLIEKHNEKKFTVLDGGKTDNSANDIESKDTAK